MRRRAAHIALFLVVGAIINGVVGVGCALLSKAPTWTTPSNPPALLPVRSLLTPLTTELQAAKSFGRSEYMAFMKEERQPVLTVGISRTLLLAGWPARSLMARDTYQTPWWWLGDGSERRLWNGWRYRVAWAGGVTVWRPSNPNWIPIRPWWPGFALNTAFYAGLAWCAAAGPRWWRRRRRARRGECLECGYPLGESPVCPECGAARAS